MPIHFTKMQALGNDFVIIDTISQKFNPTRNLIKKIADRHYGVGCDQALLVAPPRNKKEDFFYRIFNANGKEVSQCGNGARCLAKFVLEQGLTDKKKIMVGTLAGRLELFLEDDGEVKVNMGAPQFALKKIPFLAEKKALFYELALPDELKMLIRNGLARKDELRGKSEQGSGVYKLVNEHSERAFNKVDRFSRKSIGEKIKIGAIALGNPHAVITVPNVDAASVAALGSWLSKQPIFPESVNVEFMQIISRDRIRLRIYERGVGETLACGSGASAAVVIGRLWQLLNEKVAVQMPGGILNVSWQGQEQPVYLKGAAVKVFAGVY